MCLVKNIREREEFAGVQNIHRKVARASGRLGSLASHSVNFSRGCKVQLFANIMEVADCYVL